MLLYTFAIVISVSLMLWARGEQVSDYAKTTLVPITVLTLVIGALLMQAYPKGLVEAAKRGFSGNSEVQEIKRRSQAPPA